MLKKQVCHGMNPNLDYWEQLFNLFLLVEMHLTRRYISIYKYNISSISMYNIYAILYVLFREIFISCSFFVLRMHMFSPRLCRVTCLRFSNCICNFGWPMLTLALLANYDVLNQECDKFNLESNQFCNDDSYFPFLHN